MPAPSFRVDRRDLIAGAALILLALGVRLYFWRFQGIVSVDGTTYIRLSRYFFGGDYLDTQQPPGFPFLIGLVNQVLRGDGVAAAKTVDLLFGVLVLLPFYALAKDLLGRLPAVVLGVVFALTPLAIRYSVTTMSESPYVFFLVAATLAAFRGKDFLAGGLTGFAFLIRPEGLILGPALALARGFRPKAWALLLAGGFLFGALPALVYNHHTTGNWTLTRKGVNITGDDFRRNEVTPERTVNPGLDQPITDRLRDHADAIRRVYPGRLWAEIVNLRKAAGWTFLLALPLGFLLGPRFAAAGLLQALAVPLFPGVPPVERLALPLLPFALILATGAVRKLGGGDRPWASWRARAGLLALVAGWAVAAVPLVGTLTLNEDGFFPELVHAGRVLKPDVKKDDIIFCRKPYTAFYAGAQYQTTPLGDYHKTIDAMVKVGGDYLVVDQIVCQIFRPALLPLVLDSATMFNDPRLELIYFDPSLVDRHVAVYRILKPGGVGRTGEGEQLERVLGGRIPHDPARHRLHAELAWLSGNARETIREFDMAIEHDPTDVWNLKTLARFLLELHEEPERALDLAERAARLKPGDAEIEKLVEQARLGRGAREPR